MLRGRGVQRGLDWTKSRGGRAGEGRAWVLKKKIMPYRSKSWCKFAPGCSLNWFVYFAFGFLHLSQGCLQTKLQCE